MAPAATHGLRRAVLREGRTDVPVAFEGDEDADAVHLAAVDDRDLRTVGVASLLERECPARPGVHPARRLRGMAVVADRRGEGIGAVLLGACIDHCRNGGIAVLWAHARLPVVDWYEGHGLVAEGDPFIPDDVALPHRLVVRDLDHPGRRFRRPSGGVP